MAQAARNNDTQAALLMLEAGLPVPARGQHRGTPLHWAAWHGNLALVQALLRSNPPLEDAENDFHATRLGDARFRARLASQDWQLSRRRGSPARGRGKAPRNRIGDGSSQGSVAPARRQGLNRVSRREPNWGRGRTIICKPQDEWLQSG